MMAFHVTARTGAGRTDITLIAPSSAHAAAIALDLFDEPCGITVTCLG